jgi:hypothetical protein
MSITVSGTIHKSNLGAGTWALNSDGGQTYEIMHDAPTDLLKEGQKVKIKGQVRENVMSIAMIGPILEVESFEVQ